ncbi:MAG: phage virion morphogenesis protein [Tannerella sp.]|jgi:phage gpG-like protein|nr:phage virion morphogenesis protein [Tannerella sp.]
MTPNQFQQRLKETAKELKSFVEDVAPEIAGNEAVAHFRENFDREGFVDNGLKKWADVKRRDKNSPWYGFSANTGSHFSSTRAQDKILHDTGELRDSIEYEITGRGEVTIGSDKPYARVHNEGGTAKIFGKKAFTMPRRQFIGESSELDDRIIHELEREIGKIINNPNKP